MATIDSERKTKKKMRTDRIAFGSCSSQHHEQVLWPDVAARGAAAFVWGGDAVYADDFESVIPGLPAGSLPRLLKRESPATPDGLRDLYEMQLRHPGYRAMLERDDDNPSVVFGAIDDHDYGQSNGDATYEHRVESGLLFVDFLHRSSPRTDLSLWEGRARAGKGVYGVKVFDFTRPVGRELLTDRQARLDPDCCDGDVNVTMEPLSDRSVAVFVLDCRSNKTPWPRTPLRRRFRPDYGADFLGPDQWDWFEKALSRSTAAVNVIVQGLQVSADRFFDGNLVEDWSRFPVAQHRMYQVVLRSNAKSPILVSGDVHMSELLRRDCRRQRRQEMDLRQHESSRMVLEMTVSGMTHSWGTRVCARPGSSFTCRTEMADRALRMGMHLAHSDRLAWTDVVDLPQSSRSSLSSEMIVNNGKRGMQYTLELNFGELEFDWERRRIIVRVLGRNGTVLLDTDWDMDLLSGLKTVPETGRLSASDFREARERLAAILRPVGGTTNWEEEQEWICLPYRGTPGIGLKLIGVLAPVALSASIMLLPIAIPVVLASMILLRRRQGKRDGDGNGKRQLG